MAEWEVVTKSKKQKNFAKKVEERTEQKRIAALPPKLEEILPSQQYRNLLLGAAASAERESPAKSTTSSTKSKASPKKSAKAASSKEQENKKKQTQLKASTKPKSLEAALREITPADFASQLEQLKLSFPGSELLWLRGVASYFNSNLPFECDPTFSSKSIHYPSNLASAPLKDAVVGFLDSMGEENLSYFYHTLLISMTNELSKNMPIVGYKFLLQLIGQNWPQICSSDMAKTAMLRNSYQNRANIGLSILWVVGQCGYQRLVDGVKVWHNLMLPTISIKSYSKFVCEYFEMILATSKDQSLNTVNQTQFFDTYNALKNSAAGLPRELQLSIARSTEGLLLKYINSSSKHANIFLTLFRDIRMERNNELELKGCMECLLRGGDDSFKVWRMNYKKQLVPTLLLLQRIGDQWPVVGDEVTRQDSFQSFLSEIQTLTEYENESAKHKDPHIPDLLEIIASVSEKSAQQKRKQTSEQKKECSSCCKWFWGSLILIALIAGALAYDTEVNGKGVFAKSATGKVLDNAGLLPYVEKAWYTSMGASARGFKWAEKHVPPYAKPFGKLACDLWKLGKNAACNCWSAARDFASAKLPVVANFVEQYVPGLPQKIENVWVSVKTISVDIFGKAVSFFQTQVLVGRLSPENLGKALNDTQNAALRYYNLFHKKVDVYAKLK